MTRLFYPWVEDRAESTTIKGNQKIDVCRHITFSDSNQCRFFLVSVFSFKDSLLKPEEVTPILSIRAVTCLSLDMHHRIKVMIIQKPAFIKNGIRRREKTAGFRARQGDVRLSRTHCYQDDNIGLLVLCKR